MSIVTTEPAIVITGSKAIAVIAELLARIDYDTLSAQVEDELNFTENQYQEVSCEICSEMQYVGLLDDDLKTTGVISIPLT